MKAEDIDSLATQPKMVISVHEIKPKPSEWCGTNYMEEYNIDKVLDYLKIDEVPPGCGCGCRGTKRLAMKLGMDVGCSLGGIKGDWDDTLYEGDKDEKYTGYTVMVEHWGKKPMKVAEVAPVKQAPVVIREKAEVEKAEPAVVEPVV